MNIITINIPITGIIKRTNIANKGNAIKSKTQHKIVVNVFIIVFSLLFIKNKINTGWFRLQCLPPTPLVQVSSNEFSH